MQPTKKSVQIISNAYRFHTTQGGECANISKISSGICAGVLQSSSRQIFHINELDPGVPFTVEQRIEFNVCGKRSILGLPLQSSPVPLRLETTQTTISYEPQDELLRFSAVYKTSSKLGTCNSNIILKVSLVSPKTAS